MHGAAPMLATMEVVVGTLLTFIFNTGTDMKTIYRVADSRVQEAYQGKRHFHMMERRRGGIFFKALDLG